MTQNLADQPLLMHGNPELPAIEVPADFNCLICFDDLPFNPKKCQRCKAILCSKCLEGHQKESKQKSQVAKCPQCRTELPFIDLSPVESQRYAQNSKPCFHCKMNIPILDLPAHEKYCSFEKCARADCPQKARVKDDQEYFCSYYCKVYHLAVSAGTLYTPEAQKDLEVAKTQFKNSYPVAWRYSSSKHYFKPIGDDCFQVVNNQSTSEYQTILSKVGMYRGMGTFFIDITRNAMMSKLCRHKFSYKVGVTTEPNLPEGATDFAQQGQYLIIDSKLGHRSWGNEHSNVLMSNTLDQSNENRLRIDFDIHSSFSNLAIQYDDTDPENLEELKTIPQCCWYPAFSYCQNLQEVKVTLTNLAD